MDNAISVWWLEIRASQLFDVKVLKRVNVADYKLDSKVIRFGLKHFLHLRENGILYKEFLALEAVLVYGDV